MHVTSKDGSRIAYWRQGNGEPVICIGGSLDSGTENQPLADVMAQRFDVKNYSRRGRGDSTDRGQSPLRDELDDLEALAALFDSPPPLFQRVIRWGRWRCGRRSPECLSTSSPSMPSVRPPCPGAANRPDAYVDRLHKYLDAGDNDGALANFMRLAGSSEEEIQAGPSHPEWKRSAALAPSLRHDAEVLGDMQPPLSEGRTLKAIVCCDGRIRTDVRGGSWTRCRRQLSVANDASWKGKLTSPIQKCSPKPLQTGSSLDHLHY